MAIRLLHRNEQHQLSLTEFAIQEAPSYAILSHTWSSDEVSYKHIRKQKIQNQFGLKKIEFCLQRAEKDKLAYCWIDTCCINKADTIEVQHSINSMFKWYRQAAKCYAYLADVGNTSVTTRQQFAKSRWFTRGWTLQEMLAPANVEFFSSEGQFLGDKMSMLPQLEKITGVPIEALKDGSLPTFGISDVVAWVEGRQTKYEADLVYSLLGLLELTIPANYGETKEKALMRLQEENEQSKRKTLGLIAEHHQKPSSHPDVMETMRLVGRGRRSPNLRTYVEEFIASCPGCRPIHTDTSYELQGSARSQGLSRRARRPRFRPGSKVRILTSDEQLAARPWVVKSETEPGFVELILPRDIDLNPVFAVDQLTPAPRDDPLDYGISNKSDRVAFIEEILDYDRDRNRFLIKWQGRPRSENTWEPPENLTDDQIRTFHEGRRSQKQVER